MRQVRESEFAAKLDIAIEALVAALESHDGALRRRARRALQEIGEPAVLRLIDALAYHHRQVRWEAAKALAHIGDPRAATAFVKALEDDDSGVRWLAAEGLARLAPEGWAPMLRALAAEPESVLLRNGAHHVLRSVADMEEGAALAPLLEALGAAHPRVELITLAHAALASLEQGHGRQS
jgi:HEAT repeat protein